MVQCRTREARGGTSEQREACKSSCVEEGKAFGGTDKFDIRKSDVHQARVGGFWHPQSELGKLYQVRRPVLSTWGEGIRQVDRQARSGGEGEALGPKPSNYQNHEKPGKSLFSSTWKRCASRFGEGSTERQLQFIDMELFGANCVFENW